ncbi:P-loop containing nucleoside triphosphate hydrolase protein [Penicillium capsulatum]|uniref:P-loop containing nucleoside triphosphate hydrolase protein n=1 Tax=Penicillium capsulatum TaxID=69766 RepID=A0A9W9ISU9_9EURO|nr:P-loop containing nucleoside triphosphate hydrolase protein [Penicillium capsulatum]KAJ6129961.1 P-loop containing nucleoside triphosphate hydrolase protein [Penicillium capsulatum]
MADTCERLKVPFVGDAGTGKSAWLKRFLLGEIIEEYIPTIDHDIEPLNIGTTRGQCSLEIWDISGSHSTPDNRFEYFKDSDAAVIMIDLSRKKTLENVVAWYHELVAANGPHLPIVVWGNKKDIDEQDREVKPDILRWSETMGDVPYYEISCKTCDNLDEPVLWVLRQALHDPDLEFWTGAIGCSMGLGVDEESMHKYREDMSAAASFPLPDDESDL